MLISHTLPFGDGFAFNTGLEHCKGDIVVRLDSDLVLGKPWLSDLVTPFDGSEDLGVVSGVLFYPESGGINHAGLTFYQFVGRHAYLNARRDTLPSHPYPVQAMPLGFSAARRHLIEAAGGFDPSYHSGYDDLDLALRIAESGGRLLVAPNARAFHWERSAGPHRDASRKRNIALFWHRWGAKIVDDLWIFLAAGIERCSKAIAAGRDVSCVGIDLCGDRVAAKRFWTELPERTAERAEDVRLVSHRCASDGAIPLPLVLGPNCHREPRRMLFLCDSFIRLRGNAYFFEHRRRVRDDDIVVDLYGNALLLRDLADLVWPGEKIR